MYRDDRSACIHFRTLFAAQAQSTMGKHASINEESLRPLTDEAKMYVADVSPASILASTSLLTGHDSTHRFLSGLDGETAGKLSRAKQEASKRARRRSKSLPAQKPKYVVAEVVDRPSTASGIVQMRLPTARVLNIQHRSTMLLQPTGIF